MYRTAGMLGACVMAAALLGNLFAEAQESTSPMEVKAEEPSSPQIAEEIRQKLHDPVTFEFKNMGVREALQEVFKKNKIDFWIDEAALRDQEISLDEIEITCNLRNVSVRAALKRILSPSGMSWVCEDAGVRITSKVDMHASLFARIYDVADLLDDPEADPAVVPHLTALPAQLGPPGTTHENEVAPNPAKTEKAAAPDKTLVKMVTDLTGGPPNSPWMEADGEGGMLYLFQTKNSKLLVVRQNEQAHAEIEDLLNELLSRHHEVIEEEVSVPSAKTATLVPPRKNVRVVTKRLLK